MNELNTCQQDEGKVEQFDEVDGIVIHNNPITPEVPLTRQSDMSTISLEIKVLKRKGAIFLLTLLLIFLIAETITLMTTLKSTVPTITKTRNETLEQDATDMRVNITLKNCWGQYKIDSNIRISACAQPQHGKIIDIRFFLNDKATVKGIVIPYRLLDKLRLVLSDLLRV